MPTNTTPATATVIASLPYAVTQDPTGGSNSTNLPDCDDGAILTPLWWAYTPTSGQTVLGLSFDTSNHAAAYQPVLSVWTGPVGSLTMVADQCFNGGSFAYLTQFSVTPLVPIYIQVTDTSAGPPGCSLILNVTAAPAAQNASAGDFLILNDTTNFPAAVASASTGTILNVLSFPASECAATLPSGGLCVNAEDTNTTGDDSVVATNIYDFSLGLIASTSALLTAPSSAISPVSSDQAHTFYVASVDQTFPAGRRTTVGTISDTGTVGGTTWTLPANADRMSCMGVNRAGTILYYAGGAPGSSAIHAYDLVNDVALPDVLASAGGTTFIGRDLIVLGNGTFLIVYGTAANTYSVRNYSTAGSLLHSRAVGTSTGSAPRVAIGLDDPTSYWVMSFPTGAGGVTSLLTHVTVATSAVVSSVSVPQTNASGTNDQIFGASQSCPLVLMQIPAPPTIPGTTTFQIRRLIQSPTVVGPNGNRMRHKSLKVIGTPGQGLATGQGSVPVIFYQTSDDYGYTWSDIQEMSIGEQGAYETTMWAFQLGSAYQRTYRIWWTDPVDFAITKIVLDCVELSH